MHYILNKIKSSPCIENDLFSITRERKKGQPRVVSFVNPYSYMLLRNREEGYLVDHFYSDAITSSFFFSMLLSIKVPRISFDYGSFAKTFFGELSHSEDTVYFVGAKQNEIEKAVLNFKENYPKLKICGFSSGYFDHVNSKQSVIDNIKKSNAKFVVCGLGTPLQESFSREVIDNCESVSRIYTCGGFLYQSTDSINYYPHWVNKYNLRWAYRITVENYVLKRLLNQYPKFLFYVVKDRFANGRN
ncbi:WecB/TagA/CpsF family glycosyltransferase [Agarivorans gilvus]|nr:WecB/TagA/CpsF family glycosyltransferase [Agarivorans gilvus]